MAQFFHETSDGNEFRVIGVNSQAFAIADAVVVDGNGFLDNIGSTTKVLGFASDARTMASDNQTVGLIEPIVQGAIGTKMRYGTDQDVTQTDIGAYADMGTVTSGAQQLNLAAGGTGQFFVWGFDPFNEDADNVAVVEVAEPQVSGFAQT